MFAAAEQLQSSMTMESPIHGRSCIDIKETARQHDAIIPAILPLHALTGCDSVAATWTLKTKAITVARKGYTLDLLGQPMADIDKVVKQATVFIAACYGLKTPCSSMTDCRQQQWAQKIGKSSAAPKYPMLLNTSSHWLGVAAHQNDHARMGTVAVWGTNLFGQCFVLAVVVLHVQIHSVPRRV